MTTAVRARDNFVSHTAHYAIGNMARRLVGFLMLPVYTRYLTPADYGAVGLLIFAMALLEPLFGARLVQALPKFYFEAKDDRSQAAVVWSALTVTGSVSAMTMVLLILLRDPTSHLLFGTSKYALATGLFAVNMLSQPIEYTGMLYLRMRQRSRLFLGISMSKLVLQVTLNLLFVVYWRLGVVGVVLGGVLASAVTATGLTAYVARCSRPVLDSTTMARMLHFCWPLWFAGIAGLYTGSAGAVYLRVFDSLSNVGLLELGLRFATVVGLLVWSPFFQHWEPVSYRYHSEGTEPERFQVALIAVSTLMVIGGLGVSIFSEPVIHLMAAGAFHGAAKIVPVLTLGLILNNLSSFFYFSFFVTEHTRMFGYSRYLTAGILTIVYLTAIPKFGLEGAAAGQCLVFAVNFVYMYIWSRRLYDPGFDIIPTVVLVGLGAIAYVCATTLNPFRSIAINLPVKAGIFMLTAALMGVVGISAIRKVSHSAYDNILSALRRLRFALPVN